MSADLSLCEHYRQMLALEACWEVNDVDLDLPGKKLEIEISHKRGQKFKCPDCKRHYSAFDHTRERHWRHLDAMQFTTILRAKLPRVKCEEHGVRQVSASWTEPNSRFTLLFEAFAIAVISSSRSLNSAREILKMNWKTLNALIERAVKRGLLKREIKDVKGVGIDEKSIASRHTYATIVNDLGSGAVLDLVEGRSGDAAREALKVIPEKERRKVKAFATDMCDFYVNAGKEMLPKASWVVDRFHVVKRLNKAVDDCRKREHEKLTKEGVKCLSRQKFPLLKSNKQSCHPSRSEMYRKLKKTARKTAQAYKFKELFSYFYAQSSPEDSLEFFKKWYRGAVRSKVSQIKQAAKTLLNYLDGLIGWYFYPISNALSEGNNSFIQQILSDARGFRSFKNFRNRVLFFRGKLDLSIC